MGVDQCVFHELGAFTIALVKLSIFQEAKRMILTLKKSINGFSTDANSTTG